MQLVYNPRGGKFWINRGRFCRSCQLSRQKFILIQINFYMFQNIFQRISRFQLCRKFWILPVRLRDQPCPLNINVEFTFQKNFPQFIYPAIRRKTIMSHLVSNSVMFIKCLCSCRLFCHHCLSPSLVVVPTLQFIPLPLK